MNENKSIETYLFVSNKEFSLLVEDKSKNKTLYEKNENIQGFSKNNEFDLLDKFLENNIFKIEKLIKNFINNVILIIDNGNDLNINLSLRRK